MELNVYILEDIPVFQQPRYSWNCGVSHLSSNFRSGFFHYSLTHFLASVDKHRISVVLYVCWYLTRTDNGVTWMNLHTVVGRGWNTKSAATTTNTDRDRWGRARKHINPTSRFCSYVIIVHDNKVPYWFILWISEIESSIQRYITIEVDRRWSLYHRTVDLTCYNHVFTQVKYFSVRNLFIRCSRRLKLKSVPQTKNQLSWLEKCFIIIVEICTSSNKLYAFYEVLPDVWPPFYTWMKALDPKLSA